MFFFFSRLPCRRIQFHVDWALYSFERQKKVRIREAALDMRVRPEEGDTLRQEGMRVEREAQERRGVVTRYEGYLILG